MKSLFIVQNSRGRIVYEGGNRKEAANSRKAEESNSYTELRISLSPQYLEIKEDHWVNDDLCEKGKFRQVKRDINIQITNKEVVSGLLKFLNQN